LEPAPDRVNARFEKWGAALSARALAGALDGAGLAAEGLDFLAAATCTGYLCPGLSAYAAEAAGLRPDARLADLAGMGCGAALPALEQAYNFLQAHPDSSAAAVCTEICSAAVFSDDAADLVVSNALFADGSAAAVLKAAPPGEKGGGPVLRGFASLTVPAWRDTLRFRTEGGRLRNVLGREVPAQAAQALESVSADLLGRFGLARADVGRWILHPGGRKVLDAAQERLGLPPEALLSSRRVLERCGNMSSPSVLFVLKEEMESRPPRRGEWGLMASFGAGFSAHAALLEF
ncbi:MAG: type III polyketide synthase, partial [Elusimicrobiota bacterium]